MQRIAIAVVVLFVTPLVVAGASAYAAEDQWQPSVRSFEYARVKKDPQTFKESIELLGKSPGNMVAVVLELTAQRVVEFPKDNWTVAVVQGKPGLYVGPDVVSSLDQVTIFKDVAFEFRYKGKIAQELGWRMYYIFQGEKAGIYVAAPKGTKIDRGESVTLVCVFEIPAGFSEAKLKESKFGFTTAGYKPVHPAFPELKRSLGMQKE